MSRRASMAVVALALAAAVVALYAGVRDHAFVNFDDHLYVLQNPNLPLGWSRAGITRALTTTIEAYWLPLTALSLQASWALHGFHAPGYLLENVALHALAVVLLFLAFVRLTGAIGRSAFVAAVFAVHPLHVESVAWVSERKDVLAGVCFALVLLAYARHAARPSAGRLALVTLLFGAGLLAKPALVTVPCVLLLLDIWPLGRIGQRGVLLEKVPLFALAAAASAGTMATQRAFGAMAFGDTIPFHHRVLVALDAYRFYGVKAFWPTDLAAFYPYPQVVPAGDVALGGLVLAAGTAAALLAGRLRPAVAVGWLWWIGMLVPTIGLVQAGLQARADRFAHLPSIGLSVAVAWGATALLAHRPRLLRGAAAGALAACALLTTRQVEVWRNTTTLFEHALAVTRDNYFAHFRLGEAYREQGDRARAATQYEATIRLRPTWILPIAHLASLQEETGDAAGAAAGYDRVLALAPNDVETLARAGRLALEGFRAYDAALYLERAAALVPRDGGVQATLGVALARAGRTGDAVAVHRTALALRPDPWATNNLAWLLATAPDMRAPDEAVHLAEGLVGASGAPHPAWLDTLGAAYAAAARYDEAVQAAARGETAAIARGDGALAAQLRQHAAVYRTGRPVTVGSGAILEP